jgi:hypothetical protein
MQELFRVTGFQLRRGEIIDVAGKDVSQEGGTPGVIDLPEEQNPEEGKADKGRTPVVEFQKGSFCLFL